MSAYLCKTTENRIYWMGISNIRTICIIIIIVALTNDMYVFIGDIKCHGDGSCYKLIKEEMRFEEGRRLCRTLGPGGDLVSIESEEEDQFVRNMLKGDNCFIIYVFIYLFIITLFTLQYVIIVFIIINIFVLFSLVLKTLNFVKKTIPRCEVMVRDSGVVA